MRSVHHSPYVVGIQTSSYPRRRRPFTGAATALHLSIDGWKGGHDISAGLLLDILAKQGVLDPQQQTCQADGMETALLGPRACRVLR